MTSVLRRGAPLYRLASTMGTRRRFAPLGSNSAGVPVLRGIVFDMDGTLCEPQNTMFTQMRHHLNIPPQTDILQHIDSLPPSHQSPAHDTIRAIELRYMAAQTPQPGLTTLMRFLDHHAIPKAICTRNFDAPVQHLLGKFLQGSRFEPVLTREFRPCKPDPAGILHIARQWGLGDGEDGEGDASGMIMVGDSMDDMEAGRRAGAATVLLVNEANRELGKHECTDLVIERLDELVGVLEKGFEGREIGGGLDGDTTV